MVQARPAQPFFYGFMLLAILSATIVFWRLTMPPERPRPSPERVFIRAVEEGDRAKVLGMLQQGANPNTLRRLRGPANLQDERMRSTPTPVLEIAVRNGNLDLVRLLLDRGAKVNARGRYGYTALMAAAGKGDTATVGLLLARGADTEVADTIFFETALHRAARGGRQGRSGGSRSGARYAQVVRQLIAAGADVQRKDRRGLTARDVASQSGTPEVLQLLSDAEKASSRSANSPLSGAGRG